jgi:hypothetical protein
VTEPAHEVALTPDEVQEILAHCGQHALLVGGQALALWASVYEVTPPRVLAAAISSDADFIGSAELARKLGHALKDWNFWKPTFDDATVQTAKLTRTVESGIKQIDFLGAIAGLNTQAVQRRAVTITLVSGTVLRVLHPLDVLESRLQNLLLIPEKRGAVGIAQAQLAVRIANRFFNRLLTEGASTRVIFDAIERIGQIATQKQLTSVMCDYEIDVLAAVPAEKIDHAHFRMKRWPQITQAAQEQKRKYQQQRTRRTKPSMRQGPRG